jgi:hypothetical protein
LFFSNAHRLASEIGSKDTDLMRNHLGINILQSARRVFFARRQKEVKRCAGKKIQEIAPTAVDSAG